MKFKENDILFYVCPFAFGIEKVHISMGVIEGDTIYYIDQTGGYLREEFLFYNFNDAKLKALNLLYNFSIERQISIGNIKEENLKIEELE